MSLWNLYKVSAEFERAFDALMEMEDMPQDAIADTLEGLGAPVEEQAINVGAQCKNMAAQIQAIDDAMEELYIRRARLEKKALDYRTYLLSRLERHNIEKLMDAQVEIYVRRKAPRAIPTDESVIPEKFIRTKVIKTPMLPEITAALKEGEVVPGARLEVGKKSLLIK